MPRPACRSPIRRRRRDPLRAGLAAAFLLAAALLSSRAALPSPAPGPDTPPAQPAGRRDAARLLAALERNPSEPALAARLFAQFASDPELLARLLEEPAPDPARQGARAFLLGKLRLSQGDPARAAASFSRAAELLPAHPAPPAALAEAARAQGDTAAEKTALAAALDRLRAGGPATGTDPAALALRLAALHLRPPPDPQAALAALAALPDSAWNDAALSENARSLFAAAGQSPAFLEFLASKLAALDAPGGASARATLSLAETLMRARADTGDAEGFLAAANDLLRRASPGSPLDARLTTAVIESALRANLAETLLARWRRDAEQNPPSPAAALRLARLARALPDPAAEQTEYQSLLRVLETNPASEEAARRAAEIELLTGRPQQAADRLRRLLATRPAGAAPGVVFDLARALLAAGQTDRAVAEIESLLAASPDDTGLRRRALAFFCEHRLWAAAETLLRRAAASQPPAPDNDAGEALAELAGLLIARGRAGEAPALLARLIPEGRPPAETAAAHLRVADMLSERGLHQAGRERLQAALALDEANPEIRLRLAGAESALGNTGRARLELVAAAEAALRLPPSPRSRELLDEADKKLFALLTRRGGGPETGDGWVKIDLPGLGPVPLRPLPPGARALPGEIPRVAEDLSRRAAGANDPVLWRRAGLWRSLMGDHAGAAAAFESGARAAADPALRIELYDQAAAALLESGAAERAAALLETVINTRAAPGSADSSALAPLRLRLARALGAAGRVGDAAAVIEQALAAGADPFAALPVLAEIQQAAGYHADALDVWRRLLAAAPPGSPQRLGMIRNLLRPAEHVGQAASAASLLLGELARPQDPRLRAEILGELTALAARNHLGRWLEEQLAAAADAAPGDTFLAEALRQIRKTAPAAPPGPDGQAAAKTSGGSAAETPQAPRAADADASREGAAAAPFDPAPALRAAAAAFRRAGLAGEDQRAAGLELARLQEAALEFDAALATLERLGRLRPRDPEIKLRLADLRRRLGDTAAERAAVEAALAIEPDDTAVAERAARLAEAAGDRTAALVFSRQAVETWARRAAAAAGPSGTVGRQPAAAAPHEFFWPPLAPGLLSRLPGFAIAGEARAIPVQIALSQALRELHRHPAPAGAAEGGARAAYLSAVRRLAGLLAANATGAGQPDGGRAAAAELDALLARLSRSGDHGAWWNALWAAGRRADALDLLEARCRIESDPPALRVAFLRAALEARDFERIKDWLAGRGRGGAARAFIRVAVALETGERGGASPGLIPLLDAVFATDTFSDGFAGQTADLLGRLSAPAAALHLLGRLDPAAAARLPAPGPEETARWLAALGRKRDALAVLDRAAPPVPVRSAADPALRAVRLRWLLTPAAERHALARHLPGGPSGDPLRAVLLRSLEWEMGGEGRRAARTDTPPAAAFAAALGPETALDMAVALRGWGLRLSAAALLDAALDSPVLAAAADGPAAAFVTEQMRLLSRAWAAEDGGPAAAGPGAAAPALESVDFLHNLAGVLETAGQPGAAAEVYGGILSSMEEGADGREVFLRSRLLALRAAGRLGAAEAELRPLLEARAARRKGGGAGRAKAAERAADDALLAGQTAALAADYAAAGAAGEAFALLDLAGRSLPDDPALARARFDLLMALGRPGEAFEVMAALAGRQPSAGEAAALAARAAAEAGLAEKATALIEANTALPPAQRRRLLLELALASGDLDRAAELARGMLTEDPGNALPPLIHELVKRGRLAEAAWVAETARQAGCDAAALFNLRAALAMAAAERPDTPGRLARFLAAGLAEAAEPLGERGAALEFAALAEVLFRLPPGGEADEAVSGRLLELARADAGLPAERIVEIALRTGRERLLGRLAESLRVPGRHGEQTLLLAVASLQAHGRHAEAARLAAELCGQFPARAELWLMRTFSECLLTGAAPGGAFERALDLAVFDPEIYGRAGLLLADLKRPGEAAAVFDLWERLAPARNPAVAAAAAAARVAQAPDAGRAAAALREYLARAGAAPDLAPAALFRERFAPGATAAELAARLGIEPHLKNLLALAVFRRLAAERPAEALAFLEQHRQLFHIPMRPVAEFAGLAARPETGGRFRALLANEAEKEPALPLRRLLEETPPGAAPGGGAD